mmetsp:Transcript_18344/g.36046  ORF Transcript_18344/g.36046 Transcript_18344/m.36046 type:complete len:132 (-) Transcript_18344:102-497(-)
MRAERAEFQPSRRERHAANGCAEVLSRNTNKKTLLFLHFYIYTKHNFESSHKTLDAALFRQIYKAGCALGVEYAYDSIALLLVGRRELVVGLSALLLVVRSMTTLRRARTISKRCISPDVRSLSLRGLQGA